MLLADVHVSRWNQPQTPQTNRFAPKASKANGGRAWLFFGGELPSLPNMNKGLAGAMFRSLAEFSSALDLSLPS